MRKLVDLGLWLIVVPPMAFLLAGYLGALHPAFDSVAVFRLYAFAAVLIALLIVFALRRWRMALICTSALLVSGLSLVPHSISTPISYVNLTLMQSNLLWYNSAHALAPHARDRGVDIITVQEVTHRSKPQLRAMQAQFPSQKYCGTEAVGILGILSKYPALSSGCSDVAGMGWMQVQTPDGPVTIVTLHLHWPWPYGQAEQLKVILPELQTLPRPIIVAGDFNTVPWSHTVQSIEAATDTQIIPGIRASLNLYEGLIRLPIDHILIPKNASGHATNGPQLGSDHHTVFAEVFF